MFGRPQRLLDPAREPDPARVRAATAAGFSCAVSFPVAAGENSWGVIELWSRDQQRPETDLLSLLSTVGRQLGKYIARRTRDDLQARRSSEEVRLERERAQRFLDVSGAVIVVLYDSGRVELINRKGCALLGRQDHELIGRDWFALASTPAERDAARECFAQALSGEAPTAMLLETSLVTASGELRRIAWHHTLRRDETGRVVGTLSSGEDVTDRRRAEQQVAYMTYHDPLTGLPNRMRLEEHLSLALARARRSGASVGLLHLGLDSLKLVNESLGLSAGDQLLCSVAARLRESLRATDLLVRLGGDEFLVLIADINEDAVVVAEKIAQKMMCAMRRR